MTMKFRLNTGALAEVAVWAQRHVPQRHADPALSGVKISAGAMELTVAGYSYDTSGTAHVAASVDVPGNVLVSAATLSGLLKALPPKGDVELELDGTRVNLTAGRAHYTLPVMDLSSYPALPIAPPAAGVVQADAFALAVARTAFAVYRDNGKAELEGVQLSIEGSTIRFCATDGYRMSFADIQWQPEDPNVSIDLLVRPAALEGIAKAAAGDMVLHLGDNVVGFTHGSRFTTSRLMDGTKFPNVHPFRKVADNAEAIVVNVEDLTRIVNRAALVADSAVAPVIFTLEPGQEAVVTSGTETQGREVMDVQYNGDFPVEIRFQSKFILDMLRAAGTEQVTLWKKPGTKITPVLCEPVGDDSYVYVVMPIN